MDSFKEIRWTDETGNGEAEFMIPHPKEPIEPILKQFPVAPNKWDFQFLPQYSFFARIFKSLEEKAIAEADKTFLEAYERWEKEFLNVILHNETVRIQYKMEMDAYRNNVAVWDMKKAEHVKKQKIARALRENSGNSGSYIPI